MKWERIKSVSAKIRAKRGTQPDDTPAVKAKPAPKEVVKKPLVVLLPPLIVPWWIMLGLAWNLRRAGYRTKIWSYQSCRRDIPENAALLAQFLRTLGESEIDVVGFSLGAIVLRWAVTHHRIPKLRRVVFLGPPNQGAYFAEWLSEKFGALFPVIWGKGALQLRPGNKGLCTRAGRLPADTQLGVIAGGTGRARGYNPLLPGDNDFTVAVQETVLPGLTDFALVRHMHSMMPIAPGTVRMTRHFLKEGRFYPQGQRPPRAVSLPKVAGK